MLFLAEIRKLRKRNATFSPIIFGVHFLALRIGEQFFTMQLPTLRLEEIYISRYFLLDKFSSADNRTRSSN